MKRLPTLICLVGATVALCGPGMLAGSSPTSLLSNLASAHVVNATSSMNATSFETLGTSSVMLPQDPPDDQPPPPPPGDNNGGGRGRGWGGGQRGPGGGGPGAGPQGDFGGHMKGAGRAMRALHRSMENMSDPNAQAECLKAVGAIELELVAAKGQIDQVKMSDAAKQKFGTDTAAYQKEFRTELINAVSQTLELEKSILNNNADDAKANFEKLVQIQHDGHSLFQEHEHRGGAGAGGPPRGRNNGDNSDGGNNNNDGG